MDYAETITRWHGIIIDTINSSRARYETIVSERRWSERLGIAEADFFIVKNCISEIKNVIDDHASGDEDEMRRLQTIANRNLMEKLS
jgi:hypothetical protein